MSTPIIGFAGLTHLGINSAVACAERGFTVIGFHNDKEIILNLVQGNPHVMEPQLKELMEQNRAKLDYSDDIRSLAFCDVIYIAVDVPTNDKS